MGPASSSPTRTGGSQTGLKCRQLQMVGGLLSTILCRLHENCQTGLQVMGTGSNYENSELENAAECSMQ